MPPTNGPLKGLTWKSVLAIVVICIIAVLVANSFGLFAKVGINFGIVNFEVGSQPTPQSQPPVQPPASPTQQPANPSSQSQGLTGQQGAVNTLCPIESNGYELPLANTWYGPFSNGDYVMFSSEGGFMTWDSNQGYMTFSDPGGRTIQRNAWQPLQQTNFKVCVDNYNHVFAAVD